MIWRVKQQAVVYPRGSHRPLYRVEKQHEVTVGLVKMSEFPPRYGVLLTPEPSSMAKNKPTSNVPRRYPKEET